jgi:glycosyltransferase involved in cell wall biosynthesis
MNFVFPLLNLNKAGGVRIAIQYAEGLASFGYKVKIITTKPDGEYYDINEKIEIQYLNKNKNFKRSNIFLLFLFVNKINKNEVVISTSWQSTLISVLNFIDFKRIFYIIQHDDKIILNNKNLFKHILFRIIYMLPTNKISVSSWLKKHLLNKYGINSYLLSNGTNFESLNLDLPPTGYKYEKTFTILCLARSVQWKGFDDFLNAMAIVYKSHKNIKLTIVSQENIVINTVIPFIILKPSNDLELSKIYRNSDLFVFTSWVEGFGLPPLEALANGCPVVSTSCGGVDDFLINRYNSLLVPIKNPVLIACAIIELLNSECLRRNFINNGYKTANEFQLKNSLNKFVNYINSNLNI